MHTAAGGQGWMDMNVSAQWTVNACIMRRADKASRGKAGRASLLQAMRLPQCMHVQPRPHSRGRQAAAVGHHRLQCALNPLVLCCHACRGSSSCSCPWCCCRQAAAAAASLLPPPLHGPLCRRGHAAAEGGRRFQPQVGAACRKGAGQDSGKRRGGAQDRKATRLTKIVHAYCNARPHPAAGRARKP